MVHQEFGQPALGVETLHSEFVPVLFAAGMGQARSCKALLEANNIPVVLESERGLDKIYSVFARSIPVLVPDGMHDRASELIAEAERCGAAGLRCSGDEEEDEEFDDDLDDDDLDDEDFDDDFDDFDDDDEEEDFDEE
jgi:hypothetical protein